MYLIPAFEIGIWNAWIFMIWLLIQNFGVRLVSKDVYQKAGQHPDMKPSQTYKIVSNISMPLWLMTTAYSIFLPFQLGTIWFYIGLIVFLFGLTMTTVATVNFATIPINKPVIKGIYRYSRHPIYAALFLIYLSVGIASASWVFLLVAIMWAVLLNLYVTDEERYCLEAYGDTYREYMDRTPRWIGTPRRSNKK